MTLTARDDQMLYRLTVGSEAAVRLYCFPYAGGGASLYQSWRGGTPPGVELWAVQLPGRENRFLEPAIDRMDDLLDVLVPAFLPHAERPFAFFGHSMGALICWELARCLQRQGAPQPRHIFVSACRALPYQARRQSDLHTLPDAELIEALRELNGTPDGVLDDVEVARLLLPYIRADFTLAETYEYRPGAPLGCPASALGGQDDRIPVEELRAWGGLTTGPFDLRLFPGDHFYLHHAREALLGHMFQRLERTST